MTALRRALARLRPTRGRHAARPGQHAMQSWDTTGPVDDDTRVVLGGWLLDRSAGWLRPRVELTVTRRAVARAVKPTPYRRRRLGAVTTVPAPDLPGVTG